MQRIKLRYQLLDTLVSNNRGKPLARRKRGEILDEGEHASRNIPLQLQWIKVQSNNIPLSCLGRARIKTLPLSTDTSCEGHGNHFA